MTSSITNSPSLSHNALLSGSAPILLSQQKLKPLPPIPPGKSPRRPEDSATIAIQSTITNTNTNTNDNNNNTTTITIINDTHTHTHDNTHNTNTNNNNNNNNDSDNNIEKDKNKGKHKENIHDNSSHDKVPFLKLVSEINGDKVRSSSIGYGPLPPVPSAYLLHHSGGASTDALLSPSRKNNNINNNNNNNNSHKGKYENVAFDVHWWEHDALYGFESAPKSDVEAKRREKEWLQNWKHKKNELLEEWRAYEAQHTGKEPPPISSSSKYELDNSDDEDDGEIDKPWSRVITSKALSMVTNITYPTLKKLIRKGIPAHKRGKIWMERSGALAKKQLEGENIYEQLVEISPQNSPIREEIEMDIARTFSTHLLFAVRKTKDIMLRILLAYSVRNPKLGYCQNMTCIVGILLFFLNEIDTFWTFTTIMEEILPVDFCSPTLIGLRVDQKVLDVLIEERLPKLHAHFVAHHMELSCFSTSWLLRLFVDVFPIETTLRIWDCFLNEGSKILFRVALAFLKLNEEGIRSITQAGDLLMFLNQESRRFYDADKLIKTSYGFWMLRRSRINELREKFIQEVLTMDEAISALSPSTHKFNDADDDFVVLEDN